MKTVVNLLNDGETFTDVNNCALVIADLEDDASDQDEAVQAGETLAYFETEHTETGAIIHVKVRHIPGYAMRLSLLNENPI